MSFLAYSRRQKVVVRLLPRETVVPVQKKKRASCEPRLNRAKKWQGQTNATTAPLSRVEPPTPPSQAEEPAKSVSRETALNPSLASGVEGGEVLNQIGIGVVPLETLDVCNIPLPPIRVEKPTSQSAPSRYDKRLPHSLSLSAAGSGISWQVRG